MSGYKYAYLMDSVTTREVRAKYKTEYASWTNMRQRCNSPSARDYKNYGGRGIKICERWQRSFAAFLEDMGAKPESPTGNTRYYSVGRVDNNGPYSPQNCRWETFSQQGDNTRKTRKLTRFGVTKSISMWARALGVKVQTLRSRLVFLPVDSALSFSASCQEAPSSICGQSHYY